MTHERRSRRSSARDVEWVPPPWSPVSEGDRPRRRATSEPDEMPARPLETRPAPPGPSGFVFGLAIAPFFVGLLALAISRAPMLSGGGSAPQALLLLIVLQMAAAALFRSAELDVLTRSWVSTLAVTGVLVPLMALQVTLLREPYVAWSRGSASPSLVATLIVSVVLLAGATWCVVTSWNDPDIAGLLFMPLAMIVPALIGTRSTISESDALQACGKVLLLAAAATAGSYFVPSRLRILAPPVALGLEFVFLWATGYGPWFHETSGMVVRVLYSLMLALAVVLVVGVPVTALWIKHGAVRPHGRRAVARTASELYPPGSRTSAMRR